MEPKTNSKSGNKTKSKSLNKTNSPNKKLEDSSDNIRKMESLTKKSKDYLGYSQKSLGIS